MNSSPALRWEQTYPYLFGLLTLILSLIYSEPLTQWVLNSRLLTHSSLIVDNSIALLILISGSLLIIRYALSRLFLFPEFLQFSDTALFPRAFSYLYQALGITLLFLSLNIILSFSPSSFATPLVIPSMLTFVALSSTSFYRTAHVLHTSHRYLIHQQNPDPIPTPMAIALRISHK